MSGSHDVMTPVVVDRPERMIALNPVLVLICHVYPDIVIPVLTHILRSNFPVLVYVPFIGESNCGVGIVPGLYCNVLFSDPLLFPARSCARPE